MLQASGLEWIFILVSILTLILYCLANKIRIRKRVTLVICSLVSLTIFLKILDDVLNKTGITKIDYFVLQNINFIWSPLLTMFVVTITNVFNYFVAVLLIFSIFFFIKQKKTKRALLLLFGFALSYSSEGIIKILTKISRPTNPLIKSFSYSFPSGHTTVAATTFFLAAYLFYDFMKNKNQKYALIFVSVILILFTGFTRIYLSVHKFSDVAAGFALGFFIVCIIILVDEKLSRKKLG